MTDSAQGERVAFVLSGGASHGAVQVGMLGALTEAGIVADDVVGVSSGSLNAVAYATDPSPEGVERLAATWRQVRRSHIFPLRPSLILGGLGRRDHLMPNSGLRAWIERHLEIDRLEDTELPVHVVATDLETGMPVLLSRGAPAPALLASCAIPGIFPPVEIDGRLLIDGGVSAVTAIPEAQALGATTIYLLPTYDPGETQGQPRSAMAMGVYAIGHLLGWAIRHQIADAEGVTVHVLPVPRTRGISPFNLSASARLVESSFELTRVWLRGHDRASTPASVVA